MLRYRSALVVGLAVLVLAPPAGAKPAVRTLKVKGGTTTLALSQVAQGKLQAMGITMTALAPATTSGSTLSFPIKNGSVKVKGTRVKSGKVVHTGQLSLVKAPTTIALSAPTVVFGSAPVFNASIQGLSLAIGTLDLSSAKTKVKSTTLTMSNVRVRLTDTAASSMNAAFGVTGFAANDDLGIARISAKLARH